MSADNWAICPRCVATKERDLAAAQAAIDAAYGKVPVAEFDAMRQELDAKRTEEIKPTFREDYEIGVYDDEFFVSYKGRCTVCDLEHRFERSETLR